MSAAKILITDDEPQIRRVLRSALSKATSSRTLEAVKMLWRKSGRNDMT